MKYIIATVLFFCFIYVQVVYAADYTNQKNTIQACQLFGQDAAQAAGFYKSQTALDDLLGMIQGSPATDSQKERASQAIQYVWKNQISDQQAAFQLAMGACLHEKRSLAPVDDDFLSFRVNGEAI